MPLLGATNACIRKKRVTRKTHKLPALILLPAILAACGGEEPDFWATGGSGTISLPFTSSETLLASFLDSLDTVRGAANRLITQDDRYLLQEAPDGFYIDENGNGRFDRNDVSLDNASPLQHAGVHYAHAAGLTGAGEVIAISDSGFRTSHEAFAGKSVTTGSGIFLDDHGTSVASIAAGNSADMIGVAPGADLILGSFNTNAQLTATANAARVAGAVALNNSWGINGFDANTTNYNAYFGTTSGNTYLNALRDYAQADGIVIFAVDNDMSITNIGLFAGLPLLVSGIEESWLAVVNGVPVMTNDDIVSAQRISGACLEAAAWCIAADGSWTGATSDTNSSYAFDTGTSFSSPTVAGALALLAEAFPTMTHQELRIRLLASADNSFSGFVSAGSVELVDGFNHDYSTEWGHGFLNVAAALLPIGQPIVTTGSGAVLTMDDPMIVSGGASGDAVSRALNDVQVVSRDALSAPFAVRAASLVGQRSVAPLFSKRDIFNFEDAPGINRSGAAFFGSGRDMNFEVSDASYSLALYQDGAADSESFGVGLSRVYSFDGAALEVSAAFGNDTAGLLSDWNGGTDTSIFSAGMALSADISPLSAITFEAGIASGRENSELGQSANVLMSAASLSIARRNALVRDDNFNISLSLPAAVTTGSTSISLPVFSADGGITQRSVPISLVPDQREVRLSVSYDRPVSRNGTMGITLAHAENRGNIAGHSETGIMFGFRKQF